MDLSSLSPDQIRQLQGALTPKLTKFVPITPTPKQTAALLMNDIREMLYGGAAGGGKSVFLLAAALQYVDVPGYSAILFRRTFSDLMLPGALIPMSRDWLGPYEARGEVHWADKEKRWTFLDTGATLSFGYLENKNDELRYQGAEFQFVGMDEVTHIMPASYRYLFSRLRRLKGSSIPIRMRATANPGGVYGDYFYDRFFVDIKEANEGKKVKRIFLSAGLNDNPHLDAEEYRETLAELDPITREQLENGNWEIRPKGDLFDKSWIAVIPFLGIPAAVRWVRFWDLAAIDPRFKKKNKSNRDPDYTVGFKLGFHDGCYYIGDIIKVQKAPGDIEKLIYDTAEADGYSCAIRMEEEGGASGIANTLRYAKILTGYDFAGTKPVSSKIERARPVAAACQVGLVFLVDRCRNQLDFFTQIESFPNGVNDDIVDGFSGAFSHFKPKSTQFVPEDHGLRKKIIEHDRNIAAAEGRFVNPHYSGSYWHNSMNNR